MYAMNMAFRVTKKRSNARACDPRAKSATIALAIAEGRGRRAECCAPVGQKSPAITSSVVRAR